MPYLKTIKNLGSKYRLDVFLLTIFLLYFPKGGVKIGVIPLTWGYLLLFVFSLLALPNFLTGMLIRPLSKCRWLVVLMLVPFQTLVLLDFCFVGIENLGFSLSMLVAVIVLPCTFLLTFSYYFNNTDISSILILIRRGVLFISLYGIFLFFFKLLTGSFLEIPFLTVNFDDLGELEGKFIDRGGVYKLISTYNNGNIYGVCVLMLLPLYEFMEKKIVQRFIVKTSLFLSLSRTVWLGLIFYEFLKLFYVNGSTLSSKLTTILRFHSSLKISSKTLFSIFLFFIMVTALISAVFYTVYMIDADISFLFDKNLGGRLEQFDALTQFSWFPDKPFSAISEIVYLSVLNNFGIIGLVFFIPAMATPVILGLLQRVPMGKTNFKKSITAGLLIYLMVAMSDGAFLLIPVMVFYWFLVALLLTSRNVFIHNYRI